MLAIVLIFNAVAITFAVIAFRAPKVRVFDVETARRVATGSSRSPMTLSSYEADPEVTATYLSWISRQKSAAAQIQAAA